MNEQQQTVAFIWRNFHQSGKPATRELVWDVEAANARIAKFGGEHEALVTADYAEALCQQRDELLVALESIAEYWNRDANHDAMHDACWHTVDTAESAIAKSKEQ